jgi:hypothetical protein
MYYTSSDTLSAHEMTADRVFHQKNTSIKGQIIVYRAGLGTDSCWDAFCANISNRGEPSGESWLKPST